MRDSLGQARHDPSGLQVVDVVVDRGYRPDVIRASAGVPIRLVFHRQDDDPCSDRVVFSSPRIDRRLAVTGTTTIELPGQPPGEVRFTCGRGRYRGRIQILDSHRLSWATLRLRASVESPMGTALVLWIVTLPLVALLAVLALDGPAVFVAAAGTLVAWVTICRWVLRRSTQST